jgi:hypothetical protein
MGGTPIGRRPGETGRADASRSAAAVLGAVALVLATAIAVLAVLLPVPTVSGRPTPDTSDADRASVYLALLGGAGGRVFVMDHSCGDVGKRPSFDCTGPAIPAGVQAQIRAARGGDVWFGSTPPDVGRIRTVIVGFGELSIVGARARLGMEMYCGPLCGSGTTYLLARQGRTWHIIGQTGSHWIS